MFAVLSSVFEDRHLVSSKIAKIRQNKSGLIRSLSLPFSRRSLVRDVSHFSSPTLTFAFLKNLVPVHKRDEASDVSLLWPVIASTYKCNRPVKAGRMNLVSFTLTAPLQGLLVSFVRHVVTHLKVTKWQISLWLHVKKNPAKCANKLRVEHFLGWETMLTVLVALWKLGLCQFKKTKKQNKTPNKQKNNLVEPVFPWAGFGILNLFLL